jgi:hypothetical protein
MSTLQWLTPVAFADAFLQADLNGTTVVNGYGVLSTATAVANGTGRYLYADVSFRLASMTPTAGGYLSLYLLPLLDDGTTYADGTSSATATAQPSITHNVGNLALRAVASTQNGMIRGIVVPPGTFKWYLINKSGAALATGATSNTAKYRIYGEEIV